jgi:PPOX class probable F420-dependent enzyme
MAIGPEETCVLFTTFKRDGTAVSTPVWWVDLGDGTFGFWTSSASGKAKRLAHTARVTVQPCTQRGAVKPGTVPEEATARLVTGAEHEAIRQKVIAKYGIWTKLTKPLAKLAMALRGKPSFPYGDRGVIVTLGAGAPPA